MLTECPDVRTELAHLHEPVADELARVRDAFDTIIVSRFDFINDMCGHVRRYRGKMLRPLLVLLTGRACGRLDEEHVTLATVLEMVHVATLVHDDVLDEAKMRRRTKSVNAEWGNEASVLLGDYLMSHAFHLCSSLDSQEASQLLGATTNRVCEGELMQIAHRGDLTLDEPTYLEIIERKTAALTGACCLLGARHAGADTATIDAMEQYGLSLGIAFQIHDDLLDIAGSEGQCGKTLGRDLDKGTITLPVIRFLATAPQADRAAMQAMLTNGYVERRRAASELLESHGSLEYARSVAEGHIRSAVEHLSVLPPSPARDALEAAASFSTRREY